MFLYLLKNPETRRILMYLGAAGIFALIGGTVYAAAMSAVTPTTRSFIQLRQARENPAAAAAATSDQQ
ncbi:MAG: hypothetical protein JO019_03095 [Candidatus Kaiserbacteria bacterium]|nr:hypothetical protein [Candidatus Kaiserbacteria bacterium]